MPPMPVDAKPKRAASAYFLFGDSVRQGLMEENRKQNGGKCKVAEVAKQIGECWGKLGAQEKAKFEEQAKEGKEKQAVVMQAYKEANDPLSVLKEKYADLIPKKAHTSYFIFAQENKAKTEKDLRDAGEDEKALFKKITVKLGEMWKALSEADKVPWNDKAKKAVIEYEEKKKVWEATPEFVEFQRVEKEQKEKEAAQKEAAKEAEESSAKEESPKKKSKRKAADDEGAEASSPPDKKAKVEKAAKLPRTAKPAKPQAPVIDADIIKKAEGLGLLSPLKNLLDRPEVVAKDFSHAKLLSALEESGGLVNKAKYSLMGA